MKKSDKYPRGIAIKSLKDLNQKQLCSSYFQKVLENKKSDASVFCEKNRINKYRDRECTFLCSGNDELYKFWDCLVAIDYLNDKIKSNSESEEKIITIKERLNEGFRILSGIIKNVYSSIKERMNCYDKDYRIVLTVNSSNDGQFVIDTINKYYEVSNGYKRDDHNDSVEIPIFTMKNNSSTLGDGSINLDYQFHYIARDIGRIFGTCPTYSVGEECRHGVKCRKSIHLTVKSQRGEIKYSIDDHLESFRGYIKEVSDSIFREFSLVNESDVSISRVSDNSSSNGFGYSDAVKKPPSKTKKGIKSNTININDDINYWSMYWFDGDGFPNIDNLITEMNENENIKSELVKLIKRLLWKSSNSFSKNSKNFDSEVIIKQWRNYQGYKDGTSDWNIANVSIRCATSEKHLSADYKSLNDNDRQRFNKAGRQDSYRHNDFGGNSLEFKAGYNVFDPKMEVRQIDDIENKHLDVMAEYLDMKMFEDPIFLIPKPRETISYSSRFDDYYDKENYNLLGDKEKLMNLENEIFYGISEKKSNGQGMLVQEMLKDRNILNEYKSTLTASSISKTNFNQSLYGGNWFLKMYMDDPRNFLCIMFYFINKSKKEYKGIDVKICRKQYCWYGQPLESLKDAHCVKLHVEGIDSILFSTLPENYDLTFDDFNRETFLNNLTEYLINSALQIHLSNLAKDEVEIYKEKSKNQYKSDSIDDTFEKNCIAQKLHFKFLEMMSDKINKEEIYKLTCEQLENEKEWTSSLLQREGKRKNPITPELIARIIEIKLGLVNEEINGNFNKPRINRGRRLSSVSPIYMFNMREITAKQDQNNMSIENHGKDIKRLRRQLKKSDEKDKESIEFEINRIKCIIDELVEENKELTNSSEKTIKDEEEAGISHLTDTLAIAAHKITSGERPLTPVTPTHNGIDEHFFGNSKRARSKSNLSGISIES